MGDHASLKTTGLSPCILTQLIEQLEEGKPPVILVFPEEASDRLTAIWLYRQELPGRSHKIGRISAKVDVYGFGLGSFDTDETRLKLRFSLTPLATGKISPSDDYECVLNKRVAIQASLETVS